MDKAYKIVIEYVKNAILDKSYGIGDKLPPERELSELLKVSRNSVREAIRVLDITGVVESRQGAGNYISENFEKSLVETMSMMYALNRTDYKQISEFRHALELKAYMLAMEHITPEQINELKKHLDEIDSPCSDVDKAQFDKQFHLAIVQASNNWMIVQNIIALNQVLDFFIRDMRRIILQNKEGEQLLQETHRDMIRAFETKNLHMGMLALNRHFDYINAAVETICKDTK